MEQTLQIILNAKDATANAFNSAKGGLEGIQKKVDGMKPTFQKMAAAGTIAFGAVSAGIVSCLGEAIEARKGFAQLDSVLASTKGVAGVTKEAALGLADSLSKITLFTDDAILSGENLLLTFTNVGKDVFPDATTAALDMSAAMGTDLNSAVMQIGKALNDPIAGLGALSRNGVTFSQTQEDMIKSMVKSGDTMGAQKIILAELNKEFGKSAENQAKADPFAMMSKSVGELKEKIGTALLPSFEKLLIAITPIIEKVGAWAEKNPDLLAKIIMVSAGIAGLVAVMGFLGMVFGPIATGFALVGGAIATFSTFLLSTAIPAVVSFIIAFAPIIAVVALIALLAFGVYELITHWTQVKQFFADLWEAVKLIFTGHITILMTAIKLFLDTVKLIWTNTWNAIKNFFVNLWESIVSTAKAAIQSIKDFLQPIINMIDRVISRLQSIGKSVGNSVKGAVGAVGNFLGINDGIVQNGQIITTHPDDYIVATKDPASLGGKGGIVVNINGGNYLSENAALMMGDYIIGALQMQMRGS